MIDTLVHVLVTLLLPPLLLGVINKVKAVFAGRAGPPVLQLYYDLLKLRRKGSVLSTTTTWIFLAGPVVSLGTAALASLLIPLGAHAAPVSFTGDVILFIYLLALGRFFTTLAALDTGSAFEGMGAAREVTFSCLAEPALLFGMLALTRLSSGALRLSDLLGAGLASPGWRVPGAALVLIGVSWFVILLAESCRIPFDDPNTHLELTMIHEVMVLDHSGPALGLILYAAALKLFVLGAVLFRVIDPYDSGSRWLDWGIFTLGMLVLCVIIGVVESVMARLRLLTVPRLLVSACVLSAFSIALLVK